MVTNTAKVAILLSNMMSGISLNNESYFEERQEQAGLMKDFYDTQDAYLAGEIQVEDYISYLQGVVEDLFSYSSSAEQFADELYTKVRGLYTLDEDKELGLDTQLSFTDAIIG